MAEPKTKPTSASVEDFIDRQEPPARREECRLVCGLMRAATGYPPVMWGESMVGFGLYTYKYASGRTGDWPRIAFAPRKGTLVVYLLLEAEDQQLLGRLGPYKMGVSCLHLKRLSDVDLDVLKELIRRSVAHMERLYPSAVANA